MNASERQAPNDGAVPPHASDMQAHAADAAGLMKALGNESRLMVLNTLYVKKYLSQENLGGV